MWEEAGEAREIELTFELAGEVTTITSDRVMAAPLGDGLWRLLTSSWVTPRARIGNVAELEERGDGTWRLARVVRRSPFRRHQWILYPSLIESDGFAELTRKIEAEGGDWDAVFTNVVFMDVPKDFWIDVPAEIARLAELHPMRPDDRMEHHRRKRKEKPRRWWEFWRR